MDVDGIKALIQTQLVPGSSHRPTHDLCAAANLRLLRADRIRSDRCRVPLDSLLCLAAASGTRSLRTAVRTHTHTHTKTHKNTHTVVAAMSMI